MLYRRLILIPNCDIADRERAGRTTDTDVVIRDDGERGGRACMDLRILDAARYRRSAGYGCPVRMVRKSHGEIDDRRARDSRSAPLEYYSGQPSRKCYVAVHSKTGSKPPAQLFGVTATSSSRPAFTSACVPMRRTPRRTWVADAVAERNIFQIAPTN